MRYETFLYQDVLWLQRPIRLVRTVVIVHTHRNLNKDVLFLLSGHLFMVNYVRKAELMDLLINLVVIRFLTIQGLR